MADASRHADVHIFGSTSGYGTVAASRGVGDDERRELESFQFGEASTAERIARLETHAVMTGRALRSGRVAVSRMMPAGVDDAGRPTVEIITLLLSARDYEACVGALPMLAERESFWREARAGAAGGARVPAVAPQPAAGDPQVFRLFDLWLAAARVGAVGVVPEGESESVLRLVASLDPADRPNCRWGVGLLSLSAPVDICSVAAGTSMHGARDALRPAQSGAWHCGSESEYAAIRVMNGLACFPSRADVESNGRAITIADEPGAATRSRRGDARAGDGARAPGRRLLPLAIGSAVLSTVVLGVAIWMEQSRRSSAPVTAIGWASEPS